MSFLYIFFVHKCIFGIVDYHCLRLVLITHSGKSIIFFLNTNSDEELTENIANSILLKIFYDRR